jgi:SWI/SNF-related matrix-associated actin-dependent regulator of chromatin subfamily E protein 1
MIEGSFKFFIISVVNLSIGKIVGSMWREYPEEEKQELVEEWEAEKADYNVALKAYHQSAEYQAYLREKNSHR